MLKDPNFFIIGAPKCGTTTLFHWLRQHPNVSMPQTTEPHFFNTDHPASSRSSISEYQRLFAKTTDEQTAVGEKSVWYLASNEAVPNILDYNSDAKFIVCLRNPIELAYALHHQQVYGGSERLLNFAEAWRAQGARAKLTGPATTSTHLLYGPMCKLGNHVERLKSRVPEGRIHLIFLDSMKCDPQAIYRGVLDFLEIPAFTPDFRKMNEAKVPRSTLVGGVVRALGRAKRALRITPSIGVLGRVEAWNRVPQRWQEDLKMTALLRDYYQGDIALLGRLTGRELSHWLCWPDDSANRAAKPSA